MKHWVQRISVDEAAKRGDHHHIIIRLGFETGLWARYKLPDDSLWRQQIIQDIRESNETFSFHKAKNAQHLSQIIGEIQNVAGSTVRNRIHIECGNKVRSLKSRVLPSTDEARSELRYKLVNKAVINDRHGIAVPEGDFVFDDFPVIGLFNPANIRQQNKSQDASIVFKCHSGPNGEIRDRLHAVKGAQFTIDLRPRLFVAIPFLRFPVDKRSHQAWMKTPESPSYTGFLVKDQRALGTKEAWHVIHEMTSPSFRPNHSHSVEQQLPLI